MRCEYIIFGPELKKKNVYNLSNLFTLHTIICEITNYHIIDSKLVESIIIYQISPNSNGKYKYLNYTFTATKQLNLSSLQIITQNTCFHKNLEYFT